MSEDAGDLVILAGFQVGWKVHTYSCYGNQITALLCDPLSFTEWLMFVKLRTVTGTQQTRTQVHTEPEVWSEKPGREIKGMGRKVG